MTRQLDLAVRLAEIERVPRYDYRCTVCGREMEIVHAIADRVETKAHARPEDGTSCAGALERLIGFIGYNRCGVGQKPPSDGELLRAGFSKYVRGSSGYEKALGPPGTPDYLSRG